MKHIPIFLSLVVVTRNQSGNLQKKLEEITNATCSIVSDYEIIVIDNASNDESITTLKMLSSERGLPNLQVFALTKYVDSDTASWVGLENALGDFVVVIDPWAEDICFLPEMIDKAVSGTDVVFASNQQKSNQSLVYISFYTIFNWLYKSFNGVSLEKDAPHYRVLSRRVVNFILQHPQPAVTFRHLPATGGFSRINLNYSSKPDAAHKKQLGESVDRGISLLLSTNRVPMRLVTTLSLFGALSNLVYSFYVIFIMLTQLDIAPGWASLSLHQSGMFFLISLVLFIIGEYVLHMASLSNKGPLYHVGQEFTSTSMTRREKLNIEDVFSSASHNLPNSDQGVE